MNATETGPQPGYPSNPAWGARRRTVAMFLGGVLAVAAAAGATLAFSGSSDSGTGGSTATAQGAPGGQGGPGGPGGLAGGAGLMDTLHGTVVVESNGAYVTQAVQTGEVTAVDAATITVVSTDGYSKTYVLDSSTVVDNGDDEIASVATGHTVSITATVAGDTATVVELRDSALGGGQQGGPQAGQQAGRPNPSHAGRAPGRVRATQVGRQAEQPGAVGQGGLPGTVSRLAHSTGQP